MTGLAFPLSPFPPFPLLQRKHYNAMTRRRRNRSGQQGQLEQQVAPAAAAAPAAPAITVKIDISQLMLPDLATLAKLRRGELGDEETVELLQRVVVGGIAAIPVAHLGAVLRTLITEVYGAKNPKN